MCWCYKSRTTNTCAQWEELLLESCPASALEDVSGEPRQLTLTL